MAKRGLVGLVFVGILGSFALPAEGQVKRRDHRKKDDVVRVPSRPGKDRREEGIKVTGFSPQSGPVGTLITVRGDGFSRKTRVFAGRRPVRPRSVSESALTFEWPSRTRDGSIVLRHPGVARDVHVGTFDVKEDPKIVRIAPSFGVPGTRVEISGSGFSAGDQVIFNGKPLAPESLTDSRILVTIPAGARSDHFIVRRPGGAEDRSRQRFEIRLPPPEITGFTPGSGPPGTVVRITGNHFDDGDVIYWGRKDRLNVLRRGPSWVEVAIPNDAYRSDVLWVRRPGGVARSDREFVLILPPEISRFSPDQGPAGTRVTLFGRHFENSDQVYLGTTPTRVLSVEDRAIVVEIPAGVKSGLFSIYRGGRQVETARKAFEVLHPPVISGFSPQRGLEGTRVEIRGANFTADVDVFYGAQRLRVLRRTDSGLEIEIPTNARSFPFLVRTRAGEARTDVAFQVLHPSVITDITPSSGPVGTTVRIRGRGFGASDVFFLGGLTLPIVERRPHEVVVQIPTGAQSGVIEWSSHGERRASTHRFQVTVPPPRVTSVSPASAEAGERVTLRGEHLGDVDRVLFSAFDVQIATKSDAALTIIVPKGARGTDYFWLERDRQRFRSDVTFTVKESSQPPPPPATSERPYELPSPTSPGQPVKVKGDFRGLANRHVKARWSGAAPASAAALAADTATFVVPAAAKSGFCSVTVRGKVAWQGQCTIK